MCVYLEKCVLESGKDEVGGGGGTVYGETAGCSAVTDCGGSKCGEAAVEVDECGSRVVCKEVAEVGVISTRKRCYDIALRVGLEE